MTENIVMNGSTSNARCRPERRKHAKEQRNATYYLELCRKRMWHAFNGRGSKSVTANS